MRKQGKATLKVLYVTSNGYKPLNIGEQITITAGDIDVSESKINCFAAASVFQENVCYVTMSDAYGNPTGSVDDSGGFSVIASSPGKQSIEISGMATYNSEIGNRYKINVPIQVAGVWTIQGQYSDTLFTSTVNIITKAGPIDPSTSRFTCQENVPAMSESECVIDARDTYGNIAPATSSIAQLFVGVVRNRNNNDNRIPGAKVKVQDASAGKYVLTYSAPVTSASLYANVYYGQQTTSGNVLLRGIGQPLNVTVTAIELSQSESTVTCFSPTAVSGSRITCRVVAVDTNGNTIKVPSYASALLGRVVSDSGEKKIATISYNLNEFEVSFSMRKQGKATLKVLYVTSNGYKPLNIGEQITITAGDIDVSESKINCFAAASVFQENVCYFTMSDAYGNPTGSVDDSGGFSVIASSPGKQSIEISGMATYNSEIGNRYKINVPIQVAGVWTIQGQYLDTLFTSTVNIITKAGPIDPSTSRFTCQENVPAMSESECVIDARDTYGNIAPATSSIAQLFVGVVRNRNNNDNRIPGAKVKVQDASAGKYVLTYSAPVTSASLYANVYYGQQTTSGNVLLRGIGQPLNVTVTAIELSQSESTVTCFSPTAVSGSRI